MNFTDKNTIGDVVAHDYRAAAVFKNHGIDFCCNGNRSIEEACLEKNLDSRKLLNEIDEAFKNTGGGSIDFNSWPLDLLSDYIEKTHHRYTDQKISEIKPFLEKIVKVHGGEHPELARVEELFGWAGGEMAKHMKKEELILFPAIRRMVKAEISGEAMKQSPTASAGNSIESLIDEHDSQGNAFKEMRKITNDYTVPEDGCNTYKVTLAMLEEFEDNLFQHIHLENNILFPKAIDLEKRLN